MNWTKKSIRYEYTILLVASSLFFSPTALQSIFANHGTEINLNFSDAQFFLLPNKNVQLIKFTITYSVSDSDTVTKQISGAMKIYTDNSTLIKTTSITNGFKVDKTGFQQFVTSLQNTSIKSITAIVVLTELNKTSPLLNSINRNLVLNETQ